MCTLKGKKNAYLVIIHYLSQLTQGLLQHIKQVIMPCIKKFMHLLNAIFMLFSLKIIFHVIGGKEFCDISRTCAVLVLPDTVFLVMEVCRYWFLFFLLLQNRHIVYFN
jgi:hypothetical protein